MDRIARTLWAAKEIGSQSYIPEIPLAGRLWNRAWLCPRRPHMAICPPHGHTVPSLMGSIDLWIKVLHIISVIAWMAGMLYLPRLFVYHADAAPGRRPPSSSRSWTAAAQGHHESGDDRGLDFRAAARLARGILVAMAARQTGAGAAADGLHGFFSARVRAFARTPTASSRFFRFVNEVPTVFMILIVFLVVVKP